MIMNQCRICTLLTLLPHDDERDCLRAWTEASYIAADALLAEIGVREVGSGSDTRWPDAKEFQRRVTEAQGRIQQWEAFYQQIAGLLEEADLLIPQWDDPSLLEKLLRDVQITVTRRFQEGEPFEPEES